TVQVMYGGQIMERGPVRTIFTNPQSAYTWSLLQSLPDANPRVDQPLYQISGNPPNIYDLPPGDPFAPRNPFATQRCAVERPVLREVGDVPGHIVAAWYDLKQALEQRQTL